ncbi:hypothetical protein E2C01_061127 [Portunus trituberculatus]|uniref:Uncharacterized protein n=1 Tax=Portunus trituberculatus TaxID=210409 RepID=A0A5B7HDI9_PORTR|nr:hypothetical protein [Portunus trituberculatus]
MLEFFSTLKEALHNGSSTGLATLSVTFPNILRYNRWLKVYILSFITNGESVYNCNIVENCT